MENKQDMDFAIAWAEKLAQEVVPDEIDRVPFVVERFVKDEKARKKLLQQSKGNVPGGFGIDGAVLFPWILHAMSLATPFLGGLLTQRAIDSLFLIAKEIKTLLTVPRPGPHIEISDPLALQSVDSLAQTLRVAGLSVEKSKTLAYELLAFLLQDPNNAAMFLQKITERK